MSIVCNVHLECVECKIQKQKLIPADIFRQLSRQKLDDVQESEAERERETERGRERGGRLGDIERQSDGQVK